MKTRLKINGALIASATVLVIIFPHIFLRRNSAGLLALGVRISGVLLVLAGQLLRVCARGYKAENSANGDLLIQGGPYFLVRNPMYLGIFLIGMGMTLALFKYWVSYVFVVVFIIRYVALVFCEEKKLLGLFGNAYVEYSRKVPRFFPSPKKLLTKDMRQLICLRPGWLYKEVGSVCAVLLVMLLLWYWGVARG